MSVLLRGLGAVLALVLAGTTLPAAAVPAPASTRADSTGAASAKRGTETRAPAQPLRGIRIALDPGHQLGNSRYPRQTSRLVPAGGFRKPCNTTGTSTNRGVAEATVNFRLSRAVKARLTRLGARVFLTRTTNSLRRWGPCVDARGRFGERVGARLTVSLHADGAGSSGRGFHVIAPTGREPWTTDIATASLRLAKALRAALVRGGVPRSNYTAGGDGLDVRGDLGTLNLSDVPVAMIEIGNMRNAGDARRMTSKAGRARYAAAVVRGIRTYLRR
ncbi:MAG: N-acetylmuramoyl-L-alanine amidase [Marmoricola sp.]